MIGEGAKKTAIDISIQITNFFFLIYYSDQTPFSFFAEFKRLKANISVILVDTNEIQNLTLLQFDINFDESDINTFIIQK